MPVGPVVIKVRNAEEASGTAIDQGAPDGNSVTGFLGLVARYWLPFQAHPHGGRGINSTKRIASR